MIEELKQKICKCLGIEKCEIFLQDHNNAYREYGDKEISTYAYMKDDRHGLSFLIKMGPDWISTFRLVEMKGCCGIMISTNNTIYGKYTGKGLNNILNQFRIDLARELGYTILMCTDLDNNEPQRKTLIKNGWKDIYKFVNKRTNNLLNISIIDL